MNRVNQSYKILDSLRLTNGLYRASSSSDYSFVWLRDSFYEVMPYLYSDCDRYEKTYHSILDIFKGYEWKLDIHSKQKPHSVFEYIHPRYDLSGKEVDQEWGNAQHDAIGAILFGIGEGERIGKKILRNEKDYEIVQKLVYYLETCQYWIDTDNGMWEEWRELHSSSIGACVAGLEAVSGLVNVPRHIVSKGWKSLSIMFPVESADRPIDLAQLSLIYPYKILEGHDAEYVMKRVESVLLRERGVIRYQGDSYYSTIENRNLALNKYHGTEAEWCFGLPWLALCHMELGNLQSAKKYIKKAEEVMLEDGSMPELYFSKSNKYNGNTPLGWGNALYVLAKERYENHKSTMSQVHMSKSRFVTFKQVEL